MKVKVFSILFVCMLSVVAAINVHLNLNSDQCLSGLALENLNALAYAEGGKVDVSESDNRTIYKRITNDCMIYGNGKISIMGGGFIEINGSLCLENYQVSCESGGSSTCRNIECAEIWGWVN